MAVGPRISTLSHAIHTKSGVDVVAICSTPAPIEPSRSYAIESDECSQRLAMVFNELKKLVENKVKMADACQILEQLAVDTVSNVLDFDHAGR